MNTELLMRQLGLAKLECGDELEALQIVAGRRLSKQTVAWLMEHHFTSWYQLLRASHGQLLDLGLLAASVHELDRVLERVGWSFCLQLAEIDRQLNLTILPADIFLNSPSPSR